MRERQPFSSLKLPPNTPKLVELQKLLYGIGRVAHGVLAGALPAADTFCWRAGLYKAVPISHSEPGSHTVG